MKGNKSKSKNKNKNKKNMIIKDDYFREMEKNTRLFEEKLKKLKDKSKEFNETQNNISDNDDKYEINTNTNNDDSRDNDVDSPKINKNLFQSNDYADNQNVYNSKNDNRKNNESEENGLIKKLQQLVNEIEYKDNIIEDLQKKIIALREKNISLEEQNLKLTQTQIPQEKYDELNFELGRVAKELENKTRELNEITYNEKNLTNKIDNLLIQNKNLTAKEDKLMEDNDKLIAQIDKLKDEAAVSKQKITMLEKINKTSNRDYETLNNEILQLKSAKQKLENLNYDQKEKIYDYQKQINSLQKIVDDTLNKNLAKKNNGNNFDTYDYYDDTDVQTKYRRINLNKKPKNLNDNNDYNENNYNTNFNRTDDNFYQNQSKTQTLRTDNYYPQRNTEIDPVINNFDVVRNIQNKTRNNISTGRCNTMNNIMDENGGIDDDYKENIPKKGKKIEKEFTVKYGYDGYDGFNYFPSEKRLKQNKNEIDELNMQLNGLLNEKTRLECELLKLPEQSKTINDLRKKKELNNNIKETEIKVHELKLRLKNLMKA